MKLFTLLMICLLANHFLGWSLLWLTLVAVMACTIEKMIDGLVKLIFHKLTRSVIKDIVDVAVKELNEGYEKDMSENEREA